MSNIIIHDENVIAALDKAKDIAIDEIWCIRDHWKNHHYSEAFDHDRMICNLEKAVDIIEEVIATKVKILEYGPKAVSAMCMSTYAANAMSHTPSTTPAPGVSVK